VKQADGEARPEMDIAIHPFVLKVMETLENAGYRAYVVGGSVRDLLLNRRPKDWDVATDALPSTVRTLFERSAPTGERYGTVTVLGDIPVEVTTFRRDGRYLDGRRPETVEFSSSLKEDLIRRDFTINALASESDGRVVDYVGGLNDLKDRVIRSVGDPGERFREDALRMLRAHRLASELGREFSIEPGTLDAIAANAHLILNVSWERIRDELVRILMSDNPGVIRDLYHSRILGYILPELAECYGFHQSSRHHDKDVFEHTIVALESSPRKLRVRLAALLHDVGKTNTFTVGPDGEGHFYGHNRKSAEIAGEVLRRLRFDSQTISSVCMLVREHMTRHARMGKKGLKRLIARVGTNLLDDLLDLQTADVKASGHPDDLSGVLRLRAGVEKVLASGDPLTVKDLAVNGRDLIEWGMKEGREVGLVLKAMLERVLDEPSLNTKEGLRAVYEELKKGM
jgi:tRNA nucleotidyltransferase (CCA-adding enzyme)